jgi:VIT1/CCC1 family predicted Fe2+/Mn2+ transporter
MGTKEEMEIGFLRDEIMDSEVYSRLSEDESNADVKLLLKNLSETEKGHAAIWRGILGDRGKKVGGPRLMGLTILEMRIIRKLLGVAFLVKFLEMHENEGLANYESSLREHPIKGTDEENIANILKDEKSHERAFSLEAEKYKSSLDYTQSIIFGLNDGLVEILAVVAGLATVATTSFIVVILGMIAGISGTLSMAGGAYLSAKSEGLVESGVGKMKKKAGLLPIKEAYYTGIWYFFGALLAVIPFILGIGGIAESSYRHS